MGAEDVKEGVAGGEGGDIGAAFALALDFALAVDAAIGPASKASTSVPNRAEP